MATHIAIKGFAHYNAVCNYSRQQTSFILSYEFDGYVVWKFKHPSKGFYHIIALSESFYYKMTSR